jgi:hypothetical protein
VSIWQVSLRILAIVGSIGTAVLLAALGMRLWLARRVVAKRRSASESSSPKGDERELQ